MDTRLMTPDQIAASLAAQHKARAPFQPLPDGMRGNLDLAYAAQKILVDGLTAAGEGEIAG